mmetsp:Transcript_26341/g.39903  ORF Transcript_26341/g.39903 Transcript_26341/m.39903 type:complete len:503 (+) Transcript_26341:91-1599(+)
MWKSIIPARGRLLLRGRAMSSSIQSSPLFKEQAYYLNGEWHNNGHASNTFPVLDPSTEETIAYVPDIPNLTEEAITIAHGAFRSFRQTLAKERCDLLQTIYHLHQEYEDDLAHIVAWESGKPMSEALAEVRYGASYFNWFSSLGEEGKVLPSTTPGRLVTTQEEPVGVCGLISPWNFPHAMMARKIAPALRAGCTSVLKPSEETPLSVLALCELLDRAGVPAGVVNCITSQQGKEVGEALTSDMRVRKISFTGSTGVGQWLTRESADTMKLTSMELGGNAPFIICEDVASLDKALDGVMLSKFRNAGQTCVATNRVYCHESMYDEFVEKLVQRLSSLNVGRFDQEGVTMGPLIHKKSVERVDALVQDALNNGAEALVGGSPLTEAGNCFYSPTVLTNVTDNSRVVREEIFGPVCPVLKFSSIDEVVARANDTDAGLAAYVFTGNSSKFQNELEYGMIGINTGMISSEMTPFGGIKLSGYGREGSLYGLQEYQHVKSVTLQHS